MLVGIPKEIKKEEYRVGMVPASVRELISQGHDVIVETHAGEGIALQDSDFERVGAKIVATREDVFAEADMIVKVKEPQPDECKLMRENQILFTYLHLAPDPQQAKLLQESGCIAIAYETVTDNYGGLPLLVPMSQVAGRMSIQAGAHSLEKVSGGSGVLLGGVPGVKPGMVVIIGGGVVGTNAIRMAIGMEAEVMVIDRSLERLRYLDSQFGAKLETVFATQDSVEENVIQADLVVGAVLVPGASAPRIVTRDMLSRMRSGSVLVDVSIDQGGCFETSKATTHGDPTYTVDGIVHYCVANMPGAVPRTSAFALNNATLPYIIELANKGISAMQDDEHLQNGLNVCRGNITHEAVANALGVDFVPADTALSA